MKTLYYLILILTILSLSGCSSDSELLAGKIGLETNVLTVSAVKNTSVVKAATTSWILYRLKVADENGEKEYLNEFYLYDNGKGDIYNKYKESMSYDWFTVSQSQSDLKELVIDLDENDTGKSRELYIDLRSDGIGLYGDSIFIIQEPK